MGTDSIMLQCSCGRYPAEVSRIKVAESSSNCTRAESCLLSAATKLEHGCKLSGQECK